MDAPRPLRRPAAVSSPRGESAPATPTPTPTRAGGRRASLGGLFGMGALVRYLAAFGALQGRRAPGAWAALEPAQLPVDGQGLLARRLWQDAAAGQARPLPPAVLRVSDDDDFLDRLEALTVAGASTPVLARDIYETTFFLYRLPPLPQAANATAAQLEQARYYAQPYAIGNTLRGDDTLAMTVGHTAVHYVRTLAAQAGAVGTWLHALPGADEMAAAGAYQFSAWTRRGNVTETHLVDPAGLNVTLPFGRFLDVFGHGAVDLIWSRAANETLGGTYVAPTGVLPRGAGIDVMAATAAEIDAWLQARAAPALAYDRAGDAHLVVHGGAGEVRTFALAADARYGEESVATFAERFRFVDAAGRGAGDAVVAAHGAGPLVAGVRYTFVALLAGAITPQLALVAPDGGQLVVDLPTVRAALGAAGLEGLAATVREDPSAPEGEHLRLADAVLFDGLPTPALVRQRRFGDCAFQAAMLSQINANASYLYELIRPSADGSPDHVDIAWHDPHHGRPAPITLNDRILVDGDHQPLGGLVPRDARGRPIVGMALLQKGFAEANARYGLNAPRSGYAGIEYGRGHLILEMVTGRAAQRHLLDDLSDARLLTLLRGVGLGNLVTLTSLELNVPAPRDDAGFVNGHDYSVQSVDDEGGPHVRLINPWGNSVPTDLPDHDGAFRIPVSLLRPHFLALSIGPAGGG